MKLPPSRNSARAPCVCSAKSSRPTSRYHPEAPLEAFQILWPPCRCRAAICRALDAYAPARLMLGETRQPPTYCSSDRSTDHLGRAHLSARELLELPAIEILNRSLATPQAHKIIKIHSNMDALAWSSAVEASGFPQRTKKRHVDSRNHTRGREKIYANTLYCKCCTHVHE